MSFTLSFFVPGHPKPGGSKRGFYIQKLKRVVITEDCKHSKDWRAVVALKAAEVMAGVMGGRPPLEGPLEVAIRFQVARPQSHFGKRGLKPSAPKLPAKKPDLTKLWRSTEDALTGIVWKDDSQIVHQTISKSFSDQPGCYIEVSER